ncbi:unnamed protein product [Prorocentrum cordatum]|uniref:Uncharacterized protein n=1 Tax=Prorocentrum cordatum TaxID=2364126 RepID=A0ABN9T773_9DINO|nr:unnamed protein product [Polarella glacialis]
MPGPVEAAVEVAAPPTGDGVAWPDDASTTGPVLAADYRKWDAFHDEDDMNSVDGDDGGYREPALGDLDELVGPADEVALIHENWRKESRRRQRAERPQAAEPPVPSRAAEPPLPTGPVIQRPCEYRPLDGPSAAPAQAIAREYDKWQKFDVDAECLNLDNESTTAEGDRTRVSAGPQSAMLQCENYTKDREEYDLDQDIDKQMGGLKKVIAQRVKDAVARKDEGNKLIRAGRSREACVAYARGLEEMHLCEQASVLMSDSVQDKNKRLVSDLQRNLAAAQLEAGEFEGAVEICTGLLKSSGGNDEKALYRRAMALLQLGRAGDAEGDIASLAAKRGDADAAVRRLRSQSAAVN